MEPPWTQSKIENIFELLKTLEAEVEDECETKEPSDWGSFSAACDFELNNDNYAKFTNSLKILEKECLCEWELKEGENYDKGSI